MIFKRIIKRIKELYENYYGNKNVRVYIKVPNNIANKIKASLQDDNFTAAEVALRKQLCRQVEADVSDILLDKLFNMDVDENSETDSIVLLNLDYPKEEENTSIIEIEVKRKDIIGYSAKAFNKLSFVVNPAFKTKNDNITAFIENELLVNENTDTEDICFFTSTDALIITSIYFPN